MGREVTGSNKLIGNLLLPAALIGLTIIQTGCGIIPGVRDRLLDYRTEQPRTEPLELPDHFEPRVVDELLIIPDVDRDTTLSDDEEFEVPRTQPLMTVETETRVLLRESEADQWLLVLLPPEEVWINMLAYFDRKEILLVEVEPQKGVVISDWLIDGNSDEPARYRATLREGIRAGITEIRLHRQKKNQTDWVQVVDDHKSTEAEWTFKLESIREFLTATINPADTAVSFLARNLATGNRTHIKQTKEGIPLLFIGAEFPRAWSLLGPALSDLEVKIEDRDRSAGRFYLNVESVIRIDKPGFFASLFSSSDTGKTPTLWLQIKPVKGGVQVQLEIESTDDDDEFNDEAEIFLKNLESRLG